MKEQHKGFCTYALRGRLYLLPSTIASGRCHTTSLLLQVVAQTDAHASHFHQFEEAEKENLPEVADVTRKLERLPYSEWKLGATLVAAQNKLDEGRNDEGQKDRPALQAQIVAFKTGAEQSEAAGRDLLNRMNEAARVSCQHHHCRGQRHCHCLFHYGVISITRTSSS